jgi:hypothetical protein
VVPPKKIENSRSELEITKVTLQLAAICARFAYRSGCVVHGMVVRPFDEKGFPFGSFQTNFRSLVTLRDVVRHASGATRAARRFRQISAWVQCQWQHFAFMP